MGGARVKRAAGKSHSNNTQWEGLNLHPSTSLCISVKEAAVGAIKCESRRLLGIKKKRKKKIKTQLLPGYKDFCWV